MAQQVGSAESQILRVAPDDPRLTWHGILSLQPGNGWVAPWRLPYADRLLYPPELIRDAVAMPYGGRLAFRSTATTIEGRVDELQLSTINTPAMQALVGKCLTEASTVDLLCDDRLVGSTPLVGKRTFSFDGLPAGDNRLELWLPQYAPFRLVELALNPGAELMQDDDERPRWIAMLARLIRDLRADYVSLEVALNALRSVSLSPRTYGSALIGFVQTIRDGHPDIPVVVKSPVYVPNHDDPDRKHEARVVRADVRAAYGDRFVAPQPAYKLDGLGQGGGTLAERGLRQPKLVKLLGKITDAQTQD